MNNLAYLQEGDTVDVIKEFECLPSGNYVAQRDVFGLYVPCVKGKHYLEGQSHKSPNH